MAGGSEAAAAMRAAAMHQKAERHHAEHQQDQAQRDQLVVGGKKQCQFQKAPYERDRPEGRGLQEFA